MPQKVPAGVVIFRPDANVLGRLLGQLALGGRRLFLFVNGRLEAQSEAILADLSSARVLRSDINVGQGAGLNAVCGAAICEGHAHIVLFDQDSEPYADLPERLLESWRRATDAGEKLAAVGPLLIPPFKGNFRPIRYSWRPAGRNRPLAHVDFTPTSGSLVSLEAFVTVGPFRADYFIGGIDVEWGFRAWSMGYGSAVNRGLSMLHRWGEAATADEAGTPQILRHSPLRTYYYLRNTTQCLRLPYIPLAWRLHSAAVMAAQIGYLVMRGQRGSGALVSAALKDGFSGRLGPAPARFAEKEPT